MILGIVTLLIALLISAVSAWYSILGLTAIFAGAVVPAVIMGASLELGKIMVAVWLHQNWRRDRLLKFYLIPALIFLMMLTSIGVFGFLSKAHVDQNLVSGDVIAEIAIYDEKIKIERENIDADRKQLKQMDEAVDQVMGRSSDETGAERAVAIRRSQQKERGRLLAEITEGQKRITALNEERAPIAAKARKVEAEVGPVKYVAALFSNNTPDQDQLERAVRWVIILIVIVFDPLAIVLIIAGIKQLGWGRRPSDQSSPKRSSLITVDDMIVGISDDNLHPEVPVSPPVTKEPDPIIEDRSEEIEQLQLELRQAQQDRETLADYIRDQEQTVRDRTQELSQVRDILTQLHLDHSNLSQLNVRSMQREQNLQSELDQLRETLSAVQADRNQLFAAHQYEMHRANELSQMIAQTPDTFFDQARQVAQELDAGTYTAPTVEQPHELDKQDQATDPVINTTELPVARPPTTGFGDSFPNTPERGDMFLRTDFKPNRLFKWNDIKWIEVNKTVTDFYSYDSAYLQFLADKVLAGEYSLDDLNETEQNQVQAILGAYR